jgi:hypothetical protein
MPTVACATCANCVGTWNGEKAYGPTLRRGRRHELSSRPAGRCAGQPRWPSRPAGASGALTEKQLSACSEREAEALERWTRRGAPEAGCLDELIAKGDKTVEELISRRDGRAVGLDELDRDRSKVTLREDQRAITAVRDGLDGIEPPSLSRSSFERSVMRMRRGLEPRPQSRDQHSAWPQSMKPRSRSSWRAARSIGLKRRFAARLVPND